MAAAYEIRAGFDKDTIVIYQAYAPNIVEPALKHQRFVSPFSCRRMTGIKPSFLWLMCRNNRGQKSGQQSFWRFASREMDGTRRYHWVSSRIRNPLFIQIPRNGERNLKSRTHMFSSNGMPSGHYVARA